MKLVLIFGPGAVGKMTVGQELSKSTELKLFHNHMTIEPVIELFGQYNGEVTERLRDVIFSEFAKTNNAGLIFTFIWAFDQEADWAYVKKIFDIYDSVGADVYFVELNAPESIRLERNISENRLAEKASKRDLETSTKRMLDLDKRYRCVSREGEITYPNYMRIDNSYLDASTVAQMIKDRFSL